MTPGSLSAVASMAWWGLAGLGLSSGFGTWRVEIEPERTAFVDVSVLPMSTDTLLPNQTVLVEGGVVTRIGPRSVVHLPSGTRIIPGNGRVLMPGLADMHVHLDDEADLRRYLEAGVTLVRNMRGEARHLRWRDEIAAGRRLGPRIITTGPTLTGAARVNPRHVSVTNAAEASKEVRAQAAAGYDLVKVHSGLSPGLLAAIGAVTDSTRRAFVGHLMGGGLESALQAHQASIEHVDPAAWTERSIDGDMEKLAQTGTYFCPTFTTFYDGDPVRRSARHWAILAAAQRHKVELLAGTDAGLPSRQPGATLVARVHDRLGAQSVPGPTNVNCERRGVRPASPSEDAARGSSGDRKRCRSDPGAGRSSAALGTLSQVRGVMVAGLVARSE